MAWPAAIVALLLTSVGVSTAVVLAARSDGGAEVVERPYTDGSDLDTLAAARRASHALGWSIAATAVTPDDGEVGKEARTRTVRLAVADPTGRPVRGLRGTVTVSRPQRAAPLATLPLTPDGADAFRVAVPFVGDGLYDLAVDVRRADGARLLGDTRLSLR